MDSTDDPGRRGGGLADLKRSDNPVRGYSVVFVPYCTGDTHLGARTLTYTSGPESRVPNRTFQIHHVGALNAMAAMKWAFANVPNPQQVFVTGSSAGAVASPVFAAIAATHYPAARIVQLGDAGGGYRAPNIPGLLARSGVVDWLRTNPEFRTIDSTNATHAMLYILAARAATRATFAEYNAVDDSTQLGFQRLVGVRDQPLRRTLSENIAEIKGAIPAFHVYTAPGFVHTILSRPQFYSLAVDGVAFRDWLEALLNSKPLPDVGSELLQAP